MQFFNLKHSDFPAALAAISQAAGYTFADEGRLVSALTHSSYSAECPSHPQPCNERLEFLGDSVLQLIVSEALMKEFPDNQEGDLSRFRSVLVDEEANASYARQLGLPEAMLMGHGECITGGRANHSIQGDLFEAFLGAVYLDGGYEAARAVFLRLVPDVRGSALTMVPRKNPKGTLNNYVQEVERTTPVYAITGQSGPVHAPLFDCTVTVHGVEVGKGSGSTKKHAEEEAAIAALKFYKILPEEGGREETPPPAEEGSSQAAP